MAKDSTAEKKATIAEESPSTAPTSTTNENDVHIPGIDYAPQKTDGPASYSMIQPRMRGIYAQFYKETYFNENNALDPKTQELIALAASLVARCDGCIEGHVQKALKYGATKEEVSETIAIAIGINAASIVDLTDNAAKKLGLNHFPAKPSRQT